MARAGPAGAQARQAVVGRNAGVGPALSCRSGPGVEAVDCTRFCIRSLCYSGKLLLLPRYRRGCDRVVLAHNGRGLAIAVCDADLWTVGAFSVGASKP